MPSSPDPFSRKAKGKDSVGAVEEGNISYQERRSIVNVISSIVITALYAAYMVQRYLAESAYLAETFRFWGAFFVILIPVSLVVDILRTLVRNGKKAKFTTAGLKQNTDNLNFLKGLLESGVIRPVIDRYYGMEEIAAAHT